MCIAQENNPYQEDYIKSQYHILETLIQSKLEQHDLVEVCGLLNDLKPDREASTPEALDCFDDLKGFMFALVKELNDFLKRKYIANLEAQEA